MWEDTAIASTDMSHACLGLIVEQKLPRDNTYPAGQTVILRNVTSLWQTMQNPVTIVNISTCKDKLLCCAPNCLHCK